MTGEDWDKVAPVGSGEFGAGDESSAGKPIGPMGAEETPFFSIVIPAHNEEQNIGACFSSIFASTFAAFEVIFADDALWT